MAHRHEFETMYRPGVSPAVEERGIRAVWFPLYVEPETEERDILLA
jgi:hypothetical protein